MYRVEKCFAMCEAADTKTCSFTLDTQRNLLKALSRDHDQGSSYIIVVEHLNGHDLI